MPIENHVQLHSILLTCFGDFLAKLKERSGSGGNFASFEIVNENLPAGSVSLPFVRLDKIGAQHLADTVGDIVQ